jgi:RNA polymerase sigma-70 factor, ECF subfamily
MPAAALCPAGKEWPKVIEHGSGKGPPDDLTPLLVAAAGGDEAAWRELVGRYGRRIYALAKSRCGDADVAEELTQSVFATVAAKLSAGGYTERGRFESWLFRVAMNRLRDHVRRAKRRAGSLDDDAAPPNAIRQSRDDADPAALDRLREAMDSLSDADREVVTLRHHGGLSFKQMADMLNEPIGTLLARHHRALRKLKELLESGAASAREALP